MSDSKLRELTYRLVAMAPEAPPFPEEHMVQVKQAPVPARPARTWRPITVGVLATAFVLLIAGIPMFLLGGNDNPRDIAPATQPPATQPSNIPSASVPLEWVITGLEDAVTGEPIHPIDPNPDWYLRTVLVTVPKVAIVGTVNPEADVAFSADLTRDGRSFSAEVELREGLNEISFFAESGGMSVDGIVVVRYVPGADVQFAYIQKAGTQDITVAYAQWFTGPAADQAAFEDGVIASVEEGVPNGYYARVFDTELHTHRLSPDVTVRLATPQFGAVDLIETGIDDWLSLYKADGSPWDPTLETPPNWDEPDFGFFGAGTVFAPYWLTIDSQGRIVQIEQQYLP